MCADRAHAEIVSARVTEKIETDVPERLDRLVGLIVRLKLLRTEVMHGGSGVRVTLAQLRELRGGLLGGLAAGSVLALAARTLRPGGLT